MCRVRLVPLNLRQTGVLFIAQIHINMLNYNLFALTAEQIYECKLIINDQLRAPADYNLHVLRRCVKVFPY